MTIKYSFSRIWKASVAVICLALFMMSAVGFLFTQRIHHEFKNKMASNVEVLKLTTEIIGDFSELGSHFVSSLIYPEQAADVSNCIEHLNNVRVCLDNPILEQTGQIEFQQVLHKCELRLRTMLYAYQETYFADPARDKAQESMQGILLHIRDSRQFALNECQDVQAEITRQMENIVRLAERARIYLYVSLAAGLVLIMVIVFLLERELRRRLEYIIYAADRIRDGNTGYRIRMKLNDEISKVASRIDTMAEEIERKEMQLNNTNRVLSEALDEARRADMMKTEFLAHISNEIWTPMDAIVGFTGLLLEDEITQEQRRYVTMVNEASIRLREIISDMLDFSKIETGKMSIDRQTCSLQEIIQYVNSLMISAAQKKNIEFQVCRCEGLPANLKTDPVRVRQCLINLLSNAIKFTDKGHVYLNISLDKQDSSQRLRFDVEDTGIGIPADKLDDIFEPFLQIDDGAHRQAGGTGLGLSVTRKLAEMLGGYVTVKSTVGVGSIFTLFLPIESEHSSAESPLNLLNIPGWNRHKKPQNFEDSMF